jgi:hypothetical protein
MKNKEKAQNQVELNGKFNLDMIERDEPSNLVHPFDLLPIEELPDPNATAQ